MANRQRFIFFWANPEVKGTSGRIGWLACEVSLVRTTDRTQIATTGDRLQTKNS